jgi:FtsH-binding integral membrane protein
MQYIISFIGVLIFTGLTHGGRSELKRLGGEMIAGQESTRKYAVDGCTFTLSRLNQPLPVPAPLLWERD